MPYHEIILLVHLYHTTRKLTVDMVYGLLCLLVRFFILITRCVQILL